MTILTVQERGTAKPHQLRHAGIIPLGLVQRGKPTRMVQASDAQLRNALRHTVGAGMLELMVEGESKKFRVFVKQVDREPSTGKIITVTFSEVLKGETIVADVPVHSTGTPEAVELGTGVLVQATSHIKLKGQPDALPASIEVDISGLQFGDHVSAADIPLPDGAELMSSVDATVFSIQPLRAAIEETPAEEGATAAGEEAAPAGEASEESS